MIDISHKWPLGHGRQKVKSKSSFFERLRERSLERTRQLARNANAMARLIDEEQAEYESHYGEPNAEVFVGLVQRNEEARIRLHHLRGTYARRLDMTFEAVCAL